MSDSSTIDSSFLERIDNPESRKLRELLEEAIESSEKKLTEENVDYSENDIKKFASTFYYDWERDSKPEYIFLIQNPGTLQKARHFGEEVDKLRKSSTPIERVRINREYFKRWLLEKNKNFSEKFLDTLEENNLISPELEWEEYIGEGDFFRDFYATDLVKYRVKTGKIKPKKGENAESAFDNHLKEEILALRPKLVFVFGSRSWRIIKRKMKPVSVEEEIEENEDAVTKIHGHLFESKEILETYLIPLAHFSQRNHFLRNSYFEYLKEGVSKFKDKS